MIKKLIHLRVKNKKGMTAFIENVFSEKTKKLSEQIIINIAILSFVVHLILIFLNNFGVFGDQYESSGFFSSPIAAAKLWPTIWRQLTTTDRSE